MRKCFFIFQKPEANLSPIIASLMEQLKSKDEEPNAKNEQLLKENIEHIKIIAHQNLTIQNQSATIHTLKSTKFREKNREKMEKIFRKFCIKFGPKSIGNLWNFKINFRERFRGKTSGL